MLMVVVMLLCCVAASAWDFVVDGLYYDVTSENTVELVCKHHGENYVYDNDYYRYTFSIVSIPDKITCYGKTYSVTSIGSAFSGCTGLTNVTIPNSVTSIGDRAFYGCIGLTSVTIPNSVTSIEGSAFYGCTGLASVTIPNSVKRIECMAFYGCSSLTSIVIPEGVMFIDDNVFESCINLEKITFPNSLIELGFNSVWSMGAFYNTAWLKNNQDFPIIYAGKVAYRYRNPNSSSISFVEVEEGTLGIGGAAFKGSRNLKNVVIPNSVIIIGDAAFWGCTGLTSVTIPNSVTSIGSLAFSGCTSLKCVTIPESVKNIGSQAFEYCINLTSVYMQSKTPPTINEKYDKIFDNYSYNEPNNSKITMYVPIGSLAAYQAVGNWKNYYNIVEYDATAIEDVTNDSPAFELTVGGIQLTAAEGKAVAVYTAGGELVEKFDSYANEEIALDKGVYIVRVGNKAVKVKL